MHEPLDILHTVTGTVASIVDTESEPLAETPCPEWNYAQLLGHLVGGDSLFVKLLTGGPPPPPPARLAPGPDRPAPTPADYRERSTRLIAVLTDPEVRACTFQVPVGSLTGDQVIILRSVEHLLHGWDLAKAAGASVLDLEPVATVLAGPGRALLAAVGDLGDRRPFADPVELPDDASDLQRFVALFGRDPGWAPDPVAGYDRLKERFAGHLDVELPDGTRRGYGADGMRVDNRVFACTHRNRLMLKLPADEVAELIAADLGLPLAKPGQRPMREWALVPFDGSAGARADRAYAFVSGKSAA